MKKVKLLVVEWNDKEGASYYIDKDRFSKAHDTGKMIKLDAYEGTYYFDKIDDNVVIYDGVKTKQVCVKSWSVCPGIEDE